MDTDNDQRPDFRLNFGPRWYLQEKEDLFPQAGKSINIKGGLYNEMMTTPAIMVYMLNDTKWRNPVGPPPWSGNWIYRNAMDTSFVFCPTDSLDWMVYLQGSMMGGTIDGTIFPIRSIASLKKYILIICQDSMTQLFSLAIT